jgi:hypothetical protein
MVDKAIRRNEEESHVASKKQEKLRRPLSETDV